MIICGLWYASSKAHAPFIFLSVACLHLPYFLHYFKFAVFSKTIKRQYNVLLDVELRLHKIFFLFQGMQGVTINVSMSFVK